MGEGEGVWHKRKTRILDIAEPVQVALQCIYYASVIAVHHPNTMATVGGKSQPAISKVIHLLIHYSFSIPLTH